MNPTLKRVLLSIGLVALAVLMAFGIYYLFKKAAVPVGGPAAAPGAPGGQLPTAGERQPGQAAPGAPGGPTGLPSAVPITPTPSAGVYTPESISQLSTDYALYPSVSDQGGFRYHNASDGKFYQILPDGTTKAMSDQVFYNVNKVTWAKTDNKAVLEYPDGSKIVYNFNTQTQVTLPKHWQDFSFSPDSSQIAAKSLGLSPENRWLVVTNDNGSATKLLEPLGENADKVTVDWSPSQQTVALSQTGQPLGLDRSEVLFIGLHGENFKSTIVEGLDLKSQWSPTGQKLLYSVDSARSEFKPELWVVGAYGDEIGSNRQALKINTWANKCSFSDDDTLFCAVPRDLPQGAGISPDIANTIPDDFYKIDLKTGLKTNIPSTGDYTVNSISYDKATNKLIFTDKNKTGVFQVNL